MKQKREWRVGGIVIRAYRTCFEGGCVHVYEAPFSRGGKPTIISGLDLEQVYKLVNILVKAVNYAEGGDGYGEFDSPCNEQEEC